MYQSLVICCTHNPTGTQVLVRAYGKKSEVIIDRKQEIMVRKEGRQIPQNSIGEAQTHRTFSCKDGHKPTRKKQYHTTNSKHTTRAYPLQQDIGMNKQEVCVCFDPSRKKKEMPRKTVDGLCLVELDRPKEKEKSRLFGEGGHRHTNTTHTSRTANCHSQGRAERVDRREGKECDWSDVSSFFVFLGLLYSHHVMHLCCTYTKYTSNSGPCL